MSMVHIVYIEYMVMRTTTIATCMDFDHMLIKKLPIIKKS